MAPSTFCSRTRSRGGASSWRSGSRSRLPASLRSWSLWVFAEAGAAISASALPGDKLAAALVMLVLLGLAFADIALAISAFSGNRGASIGITVALLVAMYLVDALANIVDGLGAIRPLSLFRYYTGGDPLRNGLSFPDAAVLAAVAAIFLVVSIIAFERRDLAA